LRDEKKRVTDRPAAARYRCRSPESLLPLRVTYRDQLAAFAATHDKSVAPLKDRYLQELDKLQADCTKANLLDDALVVRTAREAVSPASAAKPSASGTLDDRPIIAKGHGKTDSKAAQKIVEWALANGAVVVTDQGAVGANEELKAMPTGRFAVREIKAERVVPSFPWDLLPELAELGSSP